MSRLRRALLPAVPVVALAVGAASAAAPEQRARILGRTLLFFGGSCVRGRI